MQDKTTLIRTDSRPAPRDMIKLNVAGMYSYKVLIPALPIFNQHGKPIDGIAIQVRRCLYISSAMRPEERIGVLIWLARRAWQFHTTKTQREQDPDAMVNTVVANLMIDLDAQGGLSTLINLASCHAALPHPVVLDRQFWLMRKAKKLYVDVGGQK